MPSLLAQLRTLSPTEKKTYTLNTNNLKQLFSFLGSIKTVKIVSVYEAAKIVVVECSWAEAEKIITNEFITAIDLKQTPKEELLFGFVDYAMNKISTIQHLFPQQNGNNISLSIKENLFDTLDIDLKNRVITSPYISSSVTSHASVMATMIAGGGNVWYKTKGAAWSSTISSATFANLLPEPNSYYQTPIAVQNHSYGTIVENYYGTEAVAYDASVNNNLFLNHIFSAGNSGNTIPTSGIYAGLGNYANLTGNFKQAKNIITVGHADSTGNVLSPSSKGPAYDGRIKPELVAFGEDGSSGATALVSGVAAVLHQSYKDLHNGTFAPASLIKAALLNSCDDVNNPGIDFQSGYGNLNAYKAIKTILSGNYFQGTVSNQTQQKFSLNIPSNIKQLKITLVWTDPAAFTNATKALVNDLDMEVKQLSSGTTWLPWVLNSSPSVTSLQQLPERKRDSLNVVEQITIDNPSIGYYEITVKGFAITTANQNFSIAYQLDTADTFSWHFPTGSDNLFSAQTNMIRFESNFSAVNGLLEINTGNNWQTIEPNVDLSKGYFKFITPNIFNNAILRMTVANQTFTTDTFTISRRIVPAVGLNCADTVLFTWPKIPEASSYQIHQLGNRYMELLQTTTDTFALIKKNSIASKYFSVVPMLQNKPTIRTYTYNYELQGTGCYVKSFTASLTIANEGELNLLLGSVYNVRSIKFEKYTANGFKEIEKLAAANSTTYLFTDKQLHAGTNIYRAIVELNNGQLIYANQAEIYFTGSEQAVIYPNPVKQNGLLRILPNPNSQFIFQLIDGYGRTIVEKKIIDYPERISLKHLSKGIYFYRLLKENKKVQSGKLIVN